jgi:enterochelin esterase-like enzyme
VVAYMDSHYRTLPARESRGLVGHSMGGYGATRIGLRHTDAFGALYIMSPCCLSPRPAPPDADLAKQLESVKSAEDSAKLGFFARATLATAAAWSPNPGNPPLFVDLPVKGGVPQPDVLNKWAANSPLAFIDQYIGELRRYKAISIDVGNEDGLRVDTRKLHEVLSANGIENTFEEYAGNHTNRLADRFQNHVMPFFSANLCFEKRCATR